MKLINKKELKKNFLETTNENKLLYLNKRYNYSNTNNILKIENILIIILLK